MNVDMKCVEYPIMKHPSVDLQTLGCILKTNTFDVRNYNLGFIFKENSTHFNSRSKRGLLASFTLRRKDAIQYYMSR